MRALMVTQYFWPESFRINELVESLRQKGVEVDVLTGKPNYPEGNIYPGYTASGCMDETWNGAGIHRVPLFPRGKKSALRLALNYLSYVFSATLFGPAQLRGKQPDVVFVYAISPLLQALPALFLARWKRCPMVLWVQDLWPDSLQATGYVQNRWVLALVSLMVRFIYRRSDLILISSRSFAASVQCYAPGKIPVYYPNSVDSVFCDPASGLKVDVPALDQGFNIVFAGNVGAAQSMQTIVGAATILRDHPGIRFVILGGGSKMDWLREQIARLGLHNLILTGRFPVEAMPYLLAKAQALLVTLANRPIFAATVPNKLQAYMAVGKPILACLNGEGASLVTEAKAGIAIPAEDAQGLAEAARRVFEMPEEARREMGRNAQTCYRTSFDHDKLVDTLMQHFETVRSQGR